jgi:hypothetical protein
VRVRVRHVRYRSDLYGRWRLLHTGLLRTDVRIGRLRRNLRILRLWANLSERWHLLFAGLLGQGVWIRRLRRVLRNVSFRTDLPRERHLLFPHLLGQDLRLGWVWGRVWILRLWTGLSREWHLLRAELLREDVRRGRVRRDLWNLCRRAAVLRWHVQSLLRRFRLQQLLRGDHQCGMHRGRHLFLYSLDPGGSLQARPRLWAVLRWLWHSCIQLWSVQRFSEQRVRPDEQHWGGRVHLF